MPFKIVKKDDGYYVCSPKTCHSKKGLSIDKALKQFKILHYDFLQNEGDDNKYFVHILENNYNIDPVDYINMVYKNADKKGYDKRRVFFSDDKKHKLMYLEPETNKKRYFGLNKYGDYLIYSTLESRGKLEPGYANKKRNTFQKSHGKISEIHELNKYSPNELALNLNW